MVARLALTVLAGGQFVPAGTEETVELRKAITNPVAWDGPSELPEPKREEPPRAGAGATTDAWRAFYKTVLGVDAPADAGRDDLIAAVDKHNTQQ